jgi:hypothetical protein
VGRIIPWRVSGRDSTDRNGLHELPGTTERHSETSNHNEGEISHKVSVMRMHNERDGDAKFGPIGQQADNEEKDVPCTWKAQMQPQGVEQTEGCHDSRAESDVVTRNKGEQRDEARVDEARETAGCESSGRRFGANSHDLPGFQCDHDEEQSD